MQSSSWLVCKASSCNTSSHFEILKNNQQKNWLQIIPVSWNNLNLSHCNQRHSLLLNQFYFWFVRILFRRWNNFETWRFKEIDVESDFLRIKNSENKNECEVHFDLYALHRRQLQYIQPPNPLPYFLYLHNCKRLSCRFISKKKTWK